MSQPDEYAEFYDASNGTTHYRAYRYGCRFFMTEDDKPFIDEEHEIPELASAVFGDFTGADPKPGDNVAVKDVYGRVTVFCVKVVETGAMAGFPDLPEHHVAGYWAESGEPATVKLTPGMWDFNCRAV